MKGRHGALVSRFAPEPRGDNDTSRCPVASERLTFIPVLRMSNAPTFLLGFRQSGGVRSSDLCPHFSRSLLLRNGDSLGVTAFPSFSSALRKYRVFPPTLFRADSDRDAIRDLRKVMTNRASVVGQCAREGNLGSRHPRCDGRSAALGRGRQNANIGLRWVTRAIDGLLFRRRGLSQPAIMPLST